MMKLSKSSFTAPAASRIIIGLCLCVYLVFGLYTELVFIGIEPLPQYLLEDFEIYEGALSRAVNGQDPYSIRNIGSGFFYPPPALLVVALFSRISPLFLKAAVYWVANVALLMMMVSGTARYYGFSIQTAWFWFVLCLGFAPFLELLHIGQINVITLFGIFMLLYWEEESPVLSGMGWALAIVTKATPLLFVVYLAARRRYKTILVAAGAIALISCASIVWLGFGPFRSYPDVFVWLLSQFYLDSNSQSLVAKLAVLDTPWFQGVLSRLPSLLQVPTKAVFEVFAVHYGVVQRILTLYVVGAIVVAGLCTFHARLPKEPLFIVTAFGMTLAPNILWYHHFVFLLLPILVWMGWSRLSRPVVLWCWIGLLTIQLDRYSPPYGLFIQVFGHLSLIAMLVWQIREFFSRSKVGRPSPAA